MQLQCSARIINPDREAYAIKLVAVEAIEALTP